LIKSRFPPEITLVNIPLHKAEETIKENYTDKEFMMISAR